MDKIISEHGEFNEDFPQGVSLGKWEFPETVNLVDGDWIEYDAVWLSSDGFEEPLHYRYRVCRANGDVGEWQDMILEDE